MYIPYAAAAQPGSLDVTSLVVGTRVIHAHRGAGRVAEVNLADARGRPVHVQFDGGEYHCYSAESAATKLTVSSRYVSVIHRRYAAVTQPHTADTTACIALLEAVR